MEVIENDEWKIHIFMEWVEKKQPIPCPTCAGKGEVGGGFKDIDGPQVCPECTGSGVKLVRPKSDAPPIPPKLREHMRRAWVDYCQELEDNG